jgi:hypothetical protein
MIGLSENDVPGEPTMRLHGHIYVGRTAAVLDTGVRSPVDLGELRSAADSAWRSYSRRLVADTTAAFGFDWGTLPGHHPADQEILDPPLAEHIAGHEFGICPGRCGPRERIMADERWRAGVRAAEARRRVAG